MDYQNQDILINSLKNGDEQAFSFLVDAYNRRLYGYALILTNDEAMAQDVLQNVFLRTWENRKKMRITSSLQNYLFKSVHNEFLNQYKKSRSTMVLEKKYFNTLDKVTSTYDDISFVKAIERITKEVQNLPPKCREVFIMSRKEGLTNMEISNYMNISVKTVESHMTKAYGLLKKRLRNELKTLLFLLFGLEKGLEKE